jgi:serine phosphatase RsbU (regulator of sigma subunit)
MDIIQSAETDLVILNEVTYPHAEDIRYFLRAFPTTREVPLIRLVNGDPGDIVLNHEEVVPLESAPGAIASRAAVLLRVKKLRGASDHDATLRERNAMLKDLNDRYSRELAEAHSIQNALLPSSLPNNENVQVAVWYRPMERVAGDAYFCRMLPEGVLQLVVIDVTGHGMAAALLCSMVKLALSVSQAEHASDLLADVNRILTPQLPEGRFIAMVVASYECDTGKVQLAHGGIPPAVHLNFATGEAKSVGNRGLPVGVDEDAEYEPLSFQLEEGDLLLLTSDGLTETMNREGERYGVARIGTAILESMSDSQRSIGSILEEDIISFLDGKRLNDDVTVLSLLRRR